MSGKDLDSVNGVSRYLTKYQIIKKSCKIYFEWQEWSYRGISWGMTSYLLNRAFISLANF